MRLGGSWRDVCVRNISSRGMLLQSSFELSRGTYVEVHRGCHAIVGRVVWAEGECFGVHTQDSIDIEAVIQEPDLSATNFAPVRRTNAQFERRRSPRPPAQQTESSREIARVLEFGTFISLALLAAVAAFDIVGSTLSAPLKEANNAFQQIAQR